MLRDGLKAVTVRVNDVDGVGGFVLPGDHVDVVLTRQVDKANASTEVVLQNVRVLAIDQIADERADKPAVVKAVTLEVDVDRRAEAFARGLGRQPVADAAQGRRSQRQYTRRITLERSRRAVDADAAPTGPVGVTTVECGGRRRARNTACRSKARTTRSPRRGSLAAQCKNLGKARTDGWGDEHEQVEKRCGRWRWR